MEYKENPKCRGSGILCCIPQKDRCPMDCEECFFQSGRSYLEPLEENLPNMPDLDKVDWRVLRVNDGNDSSINFKEVLGRTGKYEHKFYNTSLTCHINDFLSPVALTINPGKYTDTMFYQIAKSDMPVNLMFVRFRTNMWNRELLDEAVEYYSEIRPIILTFMAYHKRDSIPEDYRPFYVWRDRTLNPYWAIKTKAFHMIMERYRDNQWVYSCGKIEGVDTSCRHCGNCLREYFATLERMEPFR